MLFRLGLALLLSIGLALLLALGWANSEDQPTQPAAERISANSVPDTLN